MAEQNRAILELLRKRDTTGLSPSENRALLQMLRRQTSAPDQLAASEPSLTPMPSVEALAETAAQDPFMRIRPLPRQQLGAEEAVFQFVEDPQVQLAAGGIAGGVAGSAIGQPFLGTLAGTVATQAAQDVMRGEFSGQQTARKALTETAVQGLVAGVTRGSVGLIRAGLRATPPGVAAVMNRLGERTRGVGERVIQPLTRQGVRAARTAAARTRQAAGFADIQPLVDFARNLAPDERTTFLRFMRSIQPVSGRAYEQLVRGGSQVAKMPARVKSIPLEALEGMRQQIGRQIRQLERVPGQEAAARLPAGFRSTLVKYRATIDGLIDKTVTNSGLNAGVIRAARQAHFKRVAADALEQRAEQFFKTKQLLLQFEPDAFINAVTRSGSRRGDIIGRAMKDLGAQKRWKAEVQRMAGMMDGIQFERGFGALTLKFPIVSRLIRRMAIILADEQKLNVFNRTLQQVGRRFVEGNRIIPVNLVQIAVAAADPQTQATSGFGRLRQMIEGPPPFPETASQPIR